MAYRLAKLTESAVLWGPRLLFFSTLTYANFLESTPNWHTWTRLLLLGEFCIFIEIYKLRVENKKTHTINRDN